MMSGLFLFFFKQKTAYEMRISDWSSDVCSSDLPQPASSSASPASSTCMISARRCGSSRCDCGHSRYAQPAATDRKRVVSGKGVAVRVDLGGRRILKKKTTRNTCVYERMTGNTCTARIHTHTHSHK